MATTQTQYPLPETAGGLARRATLGTVVAVGLLLIAQTVVDVIGLAVDGGEAMTPFAAGPLVGTTVVSGVGAAVVYAGLVRFTDQPVRNFVVVSAVVFGLQMIPVFVLAPSMGVTAVGQAVLTVYHVLAAVPIVAFLIGAVTL